MGLPENLKRETVVTELTDRPEGCVEIGEEVAEVLESIHASFYVKRYVHARFPKPQAGESKSELCLNG